MNLLESCHTAICSQSGQQALSSNNLPRGSLESCRRGTFASTALFRNASVAAIVLAVAAGCAPQLGDLPQLVRPETLSTSTSFAAPKGDWPLDNWWKAYGDDQLDKLIEEALRDSPDLRIADARIRGAEAAASVEGANLWPTVSADGALQETEASLNQGTPPAYRSILPKGWHHAAQIKASVQYELDFFGKFREGLKAADSEADAARVEASAARLQISAAVAGTYAHLMQLFADQNAAADAIRIRSDSADVVRKRWKAGMESEASYAQAQAQLKATKVEARDIERQISVTRNQIAALLGKGPDRGLSITLSPHVVNPASLPSKLAVDLIGRRPDVVAARHITEAAAARINVANANFYPNVDLTGYFGLQTLDARLLIQGASEMGSFGPAIHLPIFDYGRNTGIYKGARAQYDIAAAQYDKAVTTALREVADAYANRRALDDELGDARSSLADIENAHRIIRIRYEGGFARYLDVLTAESALLQQRRAVVDLQAQTFAADVALVQSLGGGFVEKQ